MKYKYSFKDIGEGAGFKSLAMILPEKIAYVTNLLGGITDESLYEWYLEGIDNVLSGKSEFEERGGEGYSARIKKDSTEVYFMYDESITCTIETNELRELIEAWWKEYSVFNKDRDPTIFKTESDLVWEKVHKAMQEEMSSNPSGHKLDTEKYKKMAEELQKKK